MEGVTQDPILAPNHCVNWDLPDLSQQTSIDVDTLEYDEAPDDNPFPDPEPAGPIQAALSNSISSVSTRTKEAEALFGKISSAIDNHCSSASHGTLPERQYLAFKSFCQDLAKVAASHFDAYICDKPAPVSTLNSAIRDTNPPTFASVTRQAPAKRAPRGTNTPTISRPGTKTQPQPVRQDDRLFVRIPEGDKIRELSAYSIQSHLKTLLGNESTILTNVQPIKTGFALCPKDGQTAKLKEKLATVSLFGDAPVENAEPWFSYRIENVPRSYGAVKLINDEWKYCLEPVSTVAMHEALSAAAGVAPMAIQASRNNDANPTSSSTAWIARFPESHQRLPRTLFLFGCRTQAKPLPRRRTVAQCNRCWLWHNTRVCASDPKCRLCGSSNHSEKQHSNNCAATGAEHICPNRCINCHGPHPANDSSCELRPKASVPPMTKAQVRSIRSAYAAARLRKQAEAGCINHKTNPVQTTTDSSATTNTESASLTSTANNPYEVPDLEKPRNDQMETS